MEWKNNPNETKLLVSCKVHLRSAAKATLFLNSSLKMSDVYQKPNLLIPGQMNSECESVEKRHVNPGDLSSKIDFMQFVKRGRLSTAFFRQSRF